MFEKIPKEMKAAVLTGPGNVRIDTVPVPTVEPFEVLCRVRSVAICGTDPKLISGKLREYTIPCPIPPKYPFIAGHEWSGEVVKLGPGVDEFKIGDRVAAEPHKGCGVCRMCLTGRYTICENYGKIEKGHRHYGFTVNGAYAEYMAISIKSIHKIPNSMSFDEGAMVDTAGVCLYGLKRGRVSPGDRVAIIGPGPFGLTALQLARTLGAGETIVLGRTGPRLAMAEKLGADIVIDVLKEDPVKKVREITHGGVDVAVECVGTADSIRVAFGIVRRGGRVSLIGSSAGLEVAIDFSRFPLEDIEMIGVRADPNTCEEVIPLIAHGQVKVKPLITHKFPLTQFNDAFETFTKRLGGAIKVVINP
ncbi:MAG: alcohol dehydrogenase catalytic domain-containing protein [Candidatus Bathyarchaeia archaeon]